MSDDPRIAQIYPADPDTVQLLLGTDTGYVKDWRWVSLANGDLVLGVLIQGPVRQDVEEHRDADFEGAYQSGDLVDVYAPAPSLGTEYSMVGDPKWAARLAREAERTAAES